MSPDGRDRIVVTGVGGAPGFDLAVGLLSRGIDVIGLDADPLAPGLLIPGIIPRVAGSADSAGYPAELLGLCAELRPAALFSTVEHELPALIRMRHDLAGLGVRTWLPDEGGARACLDKAAFCAALVRDGLPVPRTWLPHEIAQVPDGVPLVVKPRYGQGSKGVYYCSERRQAAVLCELASDPVLQEHVPGREFTADCLAGRDGRASVILRWRLLVKGGLSVVSATFRDEEVVLVHDRRGRHQPRVGSAGDRVAALAGPEHPLLFLRHPGLQHLGGYQPAVIQLRPPQVLPGDVVLALPPGEPDQIQPPGPR